MVKLTRRRFLIGAVGSVALAGSGGFWYFNNVSMQKSHEREGKFLVDLHTHTPKGREEDLLRLLSSHGITGLSCVNKPGNEHRLLFEEALDLPGVTKIDFGLARVEYGGSVGYILRDQELTGRQHHVLAVGVPGEYLDDNIELHLAIERIRTEGGASVLNHPFVTPNKNPQIGPDFVRYRLLTDEERAVMYELADEVDEIEICNGQNINPTFGIYVPNMKVANEMAIQMTIERLNGRVKGVVSSDARLYEQTKFRGIYLSRPSGEPLTTEYIVDKIKNNDFENDHQGVVSRWSFVRGMFF
tara:strand:+ start:1296 stop:2195 length:900 start_codon:yes stop_codon:yes gene_type:complete